jgi:short-chain fatty acids transporter
LALQVAKNTKKVDYPYLIGAAYSGFVIWHQGLSGSVPLVIATAKHAQNFVEKITGSPVTISQSIFQPFNLIPVLLIIFTLPLLFAFIHPKEEETKTVSEEDIKDLLGEAPRWYCSAVSALRRNPGNHDRNRAC